MGSCKLPLNHVMATPFYLTLVGKVLGDIYSTVLATTTVLLGFLGGNAMSAQSSQGRVVVARISTRGETVCRALLVEPSFSARCNYYSYFLESPNAITHAFFMIKYFVLCARQAVERSLALASPYPTVQWKHNFHRFAPTQYQLMHWMALVPSTLCWYAYECTEIPIIIVFVLIY